ncbi:hypothetical protein pb186bvf_006220 [Paramecium bursaria]
MIKFFDYREKLKIFIINSLSQCLCLFSDVLNFYFYENYSEAYLQKQSNKFISLKHETFILTQNNIYS